jgi:biopolymer transport protein ExbD
MITRPSRRRPFVQIVSLIDIFTILLFYFMIFTTFRSTPAGVNINLPHAVTATTQAMRDLVITIDAQGRIYASGNRLLPADITRMARDYLAQDPNVTVTIRADQATKYENVVAVIDATRAAGAFRLRLAVDLPSGSVQ